LLDTDRAALAARDPLAEVRAFAQPEREVVAHLAAALCYGAVGQIRAAIRAVTLPMEHAPTAWIRGMRRGDLAAALGPWRYRMTGADDIDRYAASLGVLLRRHGSLEAAFVADGAEGTLLERLDRYVASLRGALEEPESRGFAYLTPRPAAGSAVKRWMLLLRWLARPDDGADLGLWRCVSPAELLLPLDTHTCRMSRALGLTRRATVDTRMMLEVSEALRSIRPDDPMALDMPLCHLGIARECLHRYDEPTCGRCPIRSACCWAAKGGRVREKAAVRGSHRPVTRSPEDDG
jgi:uncharacterized protein (TIGR02757 family)